MPEPVNPYSRENLLKIASDAAQNYQVPEDMLIRALTQESNLNPNVGRRQVQTKNGPVWISGIAQFEEGTAKNLGIDPSDPFQAIYGMAMHLGNLYKKYGDWDKAGAAYNAGEPQVDKAIKEAGSYSVLGVSSPFGGGNWLDKLQQQVGDEPKKWIDAVVRSGVGGESPVTLAEKARQAVGGGTPKPATPGPNDPPDLSQFWIQDENGGWFYDQEGASGAIKANLESQKIQRDLQLGPLSEFADDAIEQIRLDMEAGRLTLGKADTLLKTRLDAFKTAHDVYSSSSFSTGAPIGAEYVPGRGPNDYAVKTLGLPALPMSQAGGVTLDPLAEALRINQMAGEEVGKVNVPGVPNFAANRQAAYAGAMTQPPPGTPPPSPPPVPPQVASSYNASSNNPDLGPSMAPSSNQASSPNAAQRAVDPGTYTADNVAEGAVKVATVAADLAKRLLTKPGWMN